MTSTTTLGMQFGSWAAAAWYAERARAEAEQAKEHAALRSVAQLVSAAGWEPLNARVQRVVRALERWSGRTFPVLAAQTFSWGQAHAGGVILLDLSSAAQSPAVLAFRLAHEWGHQALGHQPNAYHPGGAGRWPRGHTELEDEADEYAGRFLFAGGYDVEAVKLVLARLPAVAGDVHSGGAQRAALVQRGADLEHARVRSAWHA